MFQTQAPISRCICFNASPKVDAEHVYAANKSQTEKLRQKVRSDMLLLCYYAICWKRCFQQVA